MTVWLAATAYARSGDPAVACREGADAFAASGPVELPLLRGPDTQFRPAVEASVTLGGQALPVLVVVDAAHGCSRIDPATAHALGAEVVDGLVTFDALTAGALSVDHLRAVVDPAAHGLVLGVPSLEGLAVAVLPSEGKVVFGGEAEAAGLVARVGTPIAAPPPKKAADPLPSRVPGALRWGPVVAEGTFELRTDLPESQLVASPRLPPPVDRGRRPSWDVGTRLGEVWLANTWIRQAPSAAPDPDPTFAGALGADVLFAVDLASDPATHTLAFRPAPEDRSADATGPALAAALQRYASEEEHARGTPNETLPPSDPRATVTFDGPRENVIPLGDPGNPVVRDRNLVLAETLWRAGRLEDALPRYLSAAQYAGDHCAAHLDLAERRMAWAGSNRIDKDFVAKLVEDPLERAALLWKTWNGLDESLREAVRAGHAPPGSVQVAQPAECAAVYGVLHRVLVTSGKNPAAVRLGREHATDPGIAWSQLLELLELDQYGAADAALPRSEGAVDPLWRTLAELRIVLALRSPARAEPLLAQIPGAPTSSPLLSALLVLDAATPTGAQADWTRKLLRQDPRWEPAVLVHALASGEKPPAWDPALTARAPGSPQLRCQEAVHAALSGDLPAARKLLANKRIAEPDWWAASAVVDHLAGDGAARDRDLRELAIRFPMLPIDRLGLVDPPTP